VVRLFLLVAATLSFAFEYIRSEIEGHEEPLSFSRVLTVLVVLAIFELFVTAIHASFSLEWVGLEEIASAGAGLSLGSRVPPEVNLVLLAFLWAVIGGVLALADQIAGERKAMAQKFELCIAGSAGFWLAMGILATWSVRNTDRQAPVTDSHAC
jgi:hypothetical protein